MYAIALALRSAPALELNLVAVTTLLFLGSTAPTATSGVSTSATNFGGAVNIAARPNRIANPSAPTAPLLIGESGVPARSEGEGSPESGDARECRPRGAAVAVLTDILRVDCLLGGVDIDDVDRASEEIVRVRAVVGEDTRVWLPVGLVSPFSITSFPSSSVHCRWRIMDFVAH